MISEASQHKQLFVCLCLSTTPHHLHLPPLCVHVSDDEEEGGGAARPAASRSSFKGLTHSHNKGAGAGPLCEGMGEEGEDGAF